MTLRAAGPLRSRRGGPSRPAQTGGVPRDRGELTPTRTAPAAGPVTVLYTATELPTRLRGSGRGAQLPGTGRPATPEAAALGPGAAGDRGRAVLALVLRDAATQSHVEEGQSCTLHVRKAARQDSPGATLFIPSSHAAFFLKTSNFGFLN